MDGWIDGWIMIPYFVYPCVLHPSSHCDYIEYVGMCSNHRIYTVDTQDLLDSTLLSICGLLKHKLRLGFFFFISGGKNNRFKKQKKIENGTFLVISPTSKDGYTLCMLVK